MAHVVPDLPSTKASQAAYATYYKALVNDYDPVKASMTAFETAEMDAALALVPRGDTTKLFAVNSGTWNTAGNWYPSGVPGAGAIVTIGEGCVCTYDKNDTTTAIAQIRVDGTLKADYTIDTALLFETMVITPLGFFIDGTRAHRVDSAKTHQWIINTGGGDIDAGAAAYDTFFQSRGIISIGTSDVWGAEKTPWLQVSAYTEPNIGATSLTLASTPTNWAIGDEVVICSTRCQGRSWNGYSSVNLPTKDELVTLTSVSGATIGWTGGLSYDHRGFAATATHPEFKCYVMNLTRNVRFRPSDSTVKVNQRGHMMQMHNPAGWSMRHAEIADLGRTAKVGNYDGRIYWSNATVLAGVPVDLTASPFWNGTAVDPGYTFLFEYQITSTGGAGTITIAGIDDAGAALAPYVINYGAGATAMTLDTKYIGRITSITCSTDISLLLCTVSARSRQMNQNGVRNLNSGGGTTYTAVQPISNIQGRYPFHWHKMGVTGAILLAPPVLDGCSIHGSPGWLVAQHQTHGIIKNCNGYDAQGAGLVAEDGNETGLWQGNLFSKHRGNLDASHKDSADQSNKDPARSGSAYWFTGRAMKVSSNISISSAVGIAYNPRLLDINSLLPEQMDQPTALRAHPTLEIEDDPISLFADNVTVASTLGFIIIKANQDQNHDIRSLLIRNTAWSVTIAAEFTYTQHYTVKDWNCFGGYVDATIGVTDGRSNEGFAVGTNTTDIVFVDNVFEKFDVALNLYHSNNQSTRHGEFNKPVGDTVIELSPRAAHTVVNNTAIDCATEFRAYDLGPSFVDHFLDNEDLQSDDVTLTNAAVTLQSGTNWWVSGTRNDALGITLFPAGQEDYEYGLSGSYTMAGMLTRYGYYTEGSTKWLISNEWFSSRYSGNLKKARIPIDVSALTLTGYTNNGTIDLSNNNAPVLADFTVEMVRNTNKTIDVVAMATGTGVTFGGKKSNFKTQIIENGDGTLTLVPSPDENYTETCYVWVDDANGNTTKATMTINVNKRAIYLGRQDLLAA